MTFDYNLNFKDAYKKPMILEKAFAPRKARKDSNR
jgi:hypothetical protein